LDKVETPDQVEAPHCTEPTLLNRESPPGPVVVLTIRSLG
jgi:hypothetical protein